MLHTLEQVEAVSWDPKSAPNAAYSDVIGISTNSPQHDEGILFAFLVDIETDPHYGFRLRDDGRGVANSLYGRSSPPRVSQKLEQWASASK